MDEQLFDDIRPYTDAEIPAAMHRIAADPAFPAILRYIYPNGNIEQLSEQFKKIETVEQFQLAFMQDVVTQLIKHTIAQLSSNGVEKLDKQTRYLFVSNHRDIMLDVTLLLYVLHHHGLPRAEITFGSNLMSSQLVIDIGKSNKMFKFFRSQGSAKEIIEFSQKNSAYIRHALLHKHESIWIAQRNGRTKDGNDRTDVGVLKMFAMSGGSDWVQNLGALNIAPIAISYELEPCDILKTREVYISRRQKYVKTPDEDLKSILQGVMQQKGQVHIGICNPVTTADLETMAQLPKNERFKQLAATIDRRILNNYKLFATNYIAHDTIHSSTQHAAHYTAQQKTDFERYTQRCLAQLDGDQNELKQIFLGIYANPVDNVENNKNNTSI